MLWWRDSWFTLPILLPVVVPSTVGMSVSLELEAYIFILYITCLKQTRPSSVVDLGWQIILWRCSLKVSLHDLCHKLPLLREACWTDGQSILCVGFSCTHKWIQCTQGLLKTLRTGCSQTHPIQVVLHESSGYADAKRFWIDRINFLLHEEMNTLQKQCADTLLWKYLSHFKRLGLLLGLTIVS